MTIPFNADEIFAIAEQIERNADKFYRRAAEGFEDAAGRKLLLDLADMEVEHVRIFADMRRDFSEHGGWIEISDPYDEVVPYLRAIADGLVFDVRVDPSERITGKETPEEILRMALELEKDSVVFYQGIREIVPERLGKGRIEAIIKEEMKHITQLSSQLGSLKE